MGIIATQTGHGQTGNGGSGDLGFSVSYFEKDIRKMEPHEVRYAGVSQIGTLKRGFACNQPKVTR